MNYKWKALSVTSVGMLMAAIDGTIVMLALLPIAEELHTDWAVAIIALMIPGDDLQYHNYRR